MGKKAGNKDIGADAEVLSLFTPLEIAQMRAQAAAWKSDRAALETWLEDGLLFEIQVIRKLASGEIMIGGNPGPLLAKAMIEFPKLAEKVLRLLRDEEGK